MANLRFGKVKRGFRITALFVFWAVFPVGCLAELLVPLIPTVETSPDQIGLEFARIGDRVALM